MRIVQQSVSLSYSPFLALPAPKIAGLLPAPKPTPPPAPFVYAESGLAALPDSIRTQFDHLVTPLLNTTVGLLADDLTEAEFSLAANTFARQVTALYCSAIIGAPKPAVISPFAAQRQQLNDKIDAMLAESKVHLAETRERIARELTAMHAWEDGR